MTSGGATLEPSCSEIVATTTKMPSAESMRRSRSATSVEVADVDAVDEDHPGLLAARRSARAVGVDLERQAVLAAEDVVGSMPTGLGELAVQVDALVVAVEGHHVARLDEVEHQLDLLGVAVAGGVDRGVAGRDHVAADVVEPVDGLVDRALVAGDRRGGEHHGVAARAARPAGGRCGPSAAAR